MRTAEVKIVVADTTSSLEEITAAAESAGGYVSESHLWREGERLNATITIRVPADKLMPTLARIHRAAKRVESEHVTSWYNSST